MSYQFEGIHHVQLAAPEGCETEARQFFGGILGWEEIEKPQSLQHRGGVWFICGSHQVHIGVQQSFVAARKAHPAFAVHNLSVLKKHLAQHGISVSDDELRQEEGYERFFLNDPFGNRMEFLEQLRLNDKGADGMNNKERFSNRVDDYVKYRPTYPKEAIDFLYEDVGFRTDSVIADLGAGTGIFSKLLLERGSVVIGVEPNDAMREAAIKQLSGENKYQAVNGSAEETGLPSHSVDFIVCAQSYHWFDREAAKFEFQRILKPGGKVVVIWNARKLSGSPFLEQYENLLRTYGVDYEKVAHKNITLDSLQPYFSNGGPELEHFSYEQLLDEAALKGRMLSSSYIPVVGHPNYEPMISELTKIFDRTSRDGVVAFEYVTELYWGEV